MKKLICWIGLMCISFFVVGCGNSLSDEFSEEEVTNKAEEIITLCSEGNYEEVYNDYFSGVMQVSLSQEDLEKSLSTVIGSHGELVGFPKASISGIQDKDTKTNYSRAVILTEYEKGKAQYTVVFNRELKCEGFFVK